MEYENYDDRLRHKYLNKALKEIDEKKKTIDKEARGLKDAFNNSKVDILKRIIILEADKEKMKHQIEL